MIFTPLTVPLNPEVTGAMVEAAQLARGREIDDSVFASALARIGSVAHALTETGADAAKVRQGLHRIVESLPRRPWYRVDLSLMKPLRRAAERAQRAEIKELDGPFTFAVLVDEPNNPAIQEALESAGFSLLAFRRFVAHGVVDAAKPPTEGPVRVSLHDDPFTPMEFVVEALEEIFGRDGETARALMLRVHREGHAALASMDAEEANRKVRLLEERAASRGWPLRASIERVG